jgi:hypothetical protein
MSLWCKIAAYKPDGDYWHGAWMKAGSCNDPYSPTVSPSLSPTSSPTNWPSTASPTTTQVSRISMESLLEWNFTCSVLDSNEAALVEVAKAIEESVHITMDHGSQARWNENQIFVSISITIMYLSLTSSKFNSVLTFSLLSLQLRF